MRALVVVNPRATTMTPRARDILVRALGSELKVDIAETTARGHAVELAQAARDSGVELVIAVGGDGTVNEVVNGILSDERNSAPMLAVVPGGNANVFARALGLPRDPIEATSVLIDHLRARRTRRIGLGRMRTPAGAERWFTFCAGFGIDAQVVRDVEARRTSGEPARTSMYVRSALRELYSGADRRHPAITLERPGIDPVPRLFAAIVSNTTPWTYLGPLPVTPTPAATFEAGLDVFALRSMAVVPTLRTIRQLLTRQGKPLTGRAVLTLHDQRQFTLRATHPMAVQVDGDYIGEHDHLVFRAVERAVAVVA
jgi:diacylglycerol kinase family enzyme